MDQSSRGAIIDVDKADVAACRDAFTALVEAEHDKAQAGTNEMSPERRRQVLLTLCDKLTDDFEPMMIETCAALELLPGSTFAAGTARARLMVQSWATGYGEYS